MQNAPNNIIVYYKACLLLVAMLLCQCVYAQQVDTSHTQITYLSREHSKLILPPQKYLLSPQTDIIIGTSRVYKEDRSGMGVAVTHKGVYQIGNYWHLNLGMGYTRLNSYTRNVQDSLPGTHHFVNIVHLPLGLSFIIGDDRAQAITTLNVLPAFNAGSSIDRQYRKLVTWGASTEFGFLMRVRRHIQAGLTTKLQVFKPFDSRMATVFPQYGFAGVGIMVRFSY